MKGPSAGSVGAARYSMGCIGPGLSNDYYSLDERFLDRELHGEWIKAALKEKEAVGDSRNWIKGPVSKAYGDRLAPQAQRKLRFSHSGSPISTTAASSRPGRLDHFFDRTYDIS